MTPSPDFKSPGVGDHQAIRQSELEGEQGSSEGGRGGTRGCAEFHGCIPHASGRRCRGKSGPFPGAVPVMQVTSRGATGPEPVVSDKNRPLAPRGAAEICRWLPRRRPVWGRPRAALSSRSTFPATGGEHDRARTGSFSTRPAFRRPVQRSTRTCRSRRSRSSTRGRLEPVTPDCPVSSSDEHRACRRCRPSAGWRSPSRAGDLPPLASDTRCAAPSAREGPRHPGPHLLQEQRREPGRVRTAEHRRRPGPSTTRRPGRSPHDRKPGRGSGDRPSRWPAISSPRPRGLPW